MDGFRTVGQPAAVAAVRAMLASRVPHAVLLGGAAVRRQARPRARPRGRAPVHGRRPAASGRAGRAGAAAWSSTATTRTSTGSSRRAPAARSGSASGPSGGGPVRGLAVELSLLPVEGGARVAIIRDAQRMNDDAQSALLKTLEEPPAGDHADPVRRRRGAAAADRPLALRADPAGLGRRRATSSGCSPSASSPIRRRPPGSPGWPAAGPGLAVAYAAAPEAESIRGEIARMLLDLVPAPRSTRLARRARPV